MENPTDSESGRNIALAAPTMNRAGVNIARMQSIANNRGPAVSLDFYSAKDNVVDYQRLTKTTNGLGTTFPPSWVLGSFLLP
jgi:hypothetical protein